MEAQRERDLVLAPNEYAYISDQTKGTINIYTGPYKASLSQTDMPMVFNEESGRFEQCELQSSICAFKVAPEGWYIALADPAVNGDHPIPGNPTIPELTTGRKVNIPGPASFALWPGQMAHVICGHRLKSNQFLLVRVYNDTAAQQWLDGEVAAEPGERPESTEEVVSFRCRLAKEIKRVVIGQLIIIKGTEVSFYIPPTGFEVLRDEREEFVREAESLERLEYCLLLDQSGIKRYVRGPDVVFPYPTEEFQKRVVNGVEQRKYPAIELNPNSGIYIKVIEDYEDGARKHKRGDELFITGEEQRIYFPREEHAIVMYNDAQVHYGTALPKGEGRYVLDRDKGQIDVVRGPQIFLPNPIHQVIVRRMLSVEQCTLMYPGNTEALEHNRALRGRLSEEKTAGTVMRSAALGPDVDMKLGGGLTNVVSANYASGRQYLMADAPEAGFQGDAFERRSEYTQPRTITLDTKYDGVVTVTPWTGYAIMVVDKFGQREVVEGPATRMLEYDEELEVLELSRGRPKGTKPHVKTVYLRIHNNRVSDVVETETSDFAKVHLTLSYRVRFMGEPEKWFAVANYTKLLTDHMRSKIRREAMMHDVQSFYHNAADIIRDVVLGKRAEDGQRPFTVFEENGMQIYDVEILDVALLDQHIQGLLLDAQRESIGQVVAIAAAERNLQMAVKTESLDRERREATEETRQHDAKMRQQQVATEMVVSQVKADSEREKREVALKLQAQESELAAMALADEKKRLDQELGHKEAEQALAITYGEADAAALVEKMKSISPALVQALQGFSDKELLERMATALSPFGIIDLVKGKSVLESVKRLVKGTPVADALPEGSWDGDGGNDGGPRRGRGRRAEG